MAAYWIPRFVGTILGGELAFDLSDLEIILVAL
jgi:hypothetical protein